MSSLLDQWTPKNPASNPIASPVRILQNSLAKESDALLTPLKEKKMEESIVKDVIVDGMTENETHEALPDISVEFDDSWITSEGDATSKAKTAKIGRMRYLTD